jgi:hypothetical protein
MSTPSLTGYGTQPFINHPQDDVCGSEEMLQSISALYAAALEHFHLSCQTLTEIGKIYEKVIAHQCHIKSMRRQERESQAAVVNLMQRISENNSLSVGVQQISPQRSLKRKQEALFLQNVFNE